MFDSNSHWTKTSSVHSEYQGSDTVLEHMKVLEPKRDMKVLEPKRLGDPRNAEISHELKNQVVERSITSGAGAKGAFGTVEKITHSSLRGVEEGSSIECT